MKTSEQPQKESWMSQSPAGLRRRLVCQWCLAAGYVAAMFALVPFALGLWTWLYRQLGIAFLSLIPAVGFVLFILFAAVILTRPASGRLYRLVMLTLIFAGYGLLFRFFTQSPLEHFHLLEYGLLSSVLYPPLSARFSFPKILALLLITAVGTADEIIQWLLPYRCFDLRDIVLNCTSGLLGLFLSRLFAQRLPSNGNHK